MEKAKGGKRRECRLGGGDKKGGKSWESKEELHRVQEKIR